MPLNIEARTQAEGIAKDEMHYWSACPQGIYA